MASGVAGVYSSLYRLATVTNTVTLHPTKVMYLPPPPPKLLVFLHPKITNNQPTNEHT